MSDNASVLKWVAILAIVVGAGLLLGWLGTSSSSSKPPPPAPAANPGAANVAVRPPPLPSAPTIRPAKPHRPLRTADAKSPGITKTNTAPGPAADWENKLDEILTADTTDDQKAKQMEQILLTLPEEGQIEVAQHLSNLVSDENYASLSQFLTNSTLPESVLDVLLADALNRPNTLKMPALLAVARDNRNPKAEEARDVLELFLENDYGNDWTAWETSMLQWLRDNPD